MLREQLLNSVKDANIVFLYDPVENSRWKLLRGLPAIYYLNVSNFTYPTGWAQIDQGTPRTELDYDYHVVSVSADLPMPYPDLGVITNTSTEQETSYTIRHLINDYTTAESMLFVLTDDKEFHPQGAKRPLRQEPITDSLGRYETVYDQFETAYADAGWQLPFTETKNLFVQDNANLYELVNGESVSDSVELFSELPDAPYLPLYDSFIKIFSRPDEYGAVPLDPENELPGLVRWLRRRIEWDRQTARTVARRLNEAVVADGSTFDRGGIHRNPKVANARQSTQELNPKVSSIDKRYSKWLTRYEL